MCVHTHVVGPQVAELVQRYRAGDVDGARALDAELRPSIELLRAAPNPIAIKAALNLLGHEVGGHRLPLVEATARGARRGSRLPRAARPRRLDPRLTRFELGLRAHGHGHALHGVVRVAADVPFRHDRLDVPRGVGCAAGEDVVPG